MIALGNDHTALEMKRWVIEVLDELGLAYRDFGSDGKEACDYPVPARLAAEAVARGECELGILICGTGIGISISANKVRGIRAAVCSEPFTAGHTRENNGSQIIAFGAFVVGPEMAKAIVDAFLGTEFKGLVDQEFNDRFNKIAAIEDEELAIAQG